jgi:ABC-type branched-subunit amino acid transport system ATPase component
MLVVKNLRVHYGKIEVLKGVSLNVRPGEIVTVIGGNVTGKTTLLRAVSGFAKGGVLSLDEVGSLPLSAQAKLLTAIERREIRRRGSTRVEPVDTWIFSAINEDLAANQPFTDPATRPSTIQRWMKT